MTKEGCHFSGKIGVTPSVAAPGYTNPSDTTESNTESVNDMYGTS